MLYYIYDYFFVLDVFLLCLLLKAEGPARRPRFPLDPELQKRMRFHHISPAVYVNARACKTLTAWGWCSQLEWKGVSPSQCTLCQDSCCEECASTAWCLTSGAHSSVLNAPNAAPRNANVQLVLQTPRSMENAALSGADASMRIAASALNKQDHSPHQKAIVCLPLFAVSRSCFLILFNASRADFCDGSYCHTWIQK